MTASLILTNPDPEALVMMHWKQQSGACSASDDVLSYEVGCSKVQALLFIGMCYSEVMTFDTAFQPGPASSTLR